MRTHNRFVSRRRQQGGFTLVEVIVSAGLLCLVLVGTVVLFTSTCRLWRVGTSGTSANIYGSLAMRKIVTDIQEGQSAYAEGNRLCVQYPYYDTGSGIYDRNTQGDLAEFYLSGDNGTETPSSNGDNTLWKQVGDTRTRVAAHIHNFEFDLAGSTLLRLRVWGWQSENASINPDLVQQSVSLRNH